MNGSIHRAALAAAGAIAVLGPAAAAREWTAYVGTYTRRTSEGIYAFAFNGETGRLTPLGLAASARTPSFLAVSSDHRLLYVSNELTRTSGGEGAQGLGWVSAYAIPPGDFHLKFINRQSSGGEGPAYIAVDRGNHWVYAAHYNSGSVVAFPLQADGSIGPLAGLQQDAASDLPSGNRRLQQPHAHCVVLDPAERFLYCCDLGADRVMVYRVNRAGQPFELANPPAVTIPRGSGPRHILLRTATRCAYVVNEINSTVSVLDWQEAEGGLKLRQTRSTLPAGWKGASTAAEVQIAPDGRFLYISNRGHDSIAVFPIGPDGALGAPTTVPSGGRTPRFFTFDPTGRFLVVGNEDSECLVTFSVDAKTGLPEQLPGTAAVSMPGCIVFVPR